MAQNTEPKVHKLYTAKQLGLQDEADTIYAATTYEDTHGICRFLGIYKGHAADIKTAAAGRFNLSKKNIDLQPVTGTNISQHWTPLEV